MFEKPFCFHFVGGVIACLASFPAFADSGHDPRDAFDLQSDVFTHGHETGNVRTKDNIIEIYGRVFMALAYNYMNEGEEHDTPLDEHAETRHAYLTSSGTRLGFRGNKTLDNGVTGFWQIESSIDLTNLGEGAADDHGGNESELAGRDSFVGLGTPYGTIVFGKHNSPYKMAVHTWDPFNHVAGDLRSILGRVDGFTNDYDHHGNIYHTRVPNMIVYYLPQASKFDISVGLGNLAEETDVDGDVPLFSLSIKYQFGPAMFHYAFERHRKLESYINEDMEAAAQAPILVSESQAHLGAVSLKFGTTLVSVIGEQIQFFDSSAAFPHDGARRFAGHVGITHDIRQHSFRLAYAQSRNFYGADAGVLIAAGWFYRLGTETLTYLSYATVKNAEYGNFGTFFTENLPFKSNPSTFSLGLIHSF